MKHAITKREIGDVLRRAARLHAAGQLAEAGQIYDRVLEAEPRNGDALNLKAAIYNGTGRHEEALVLLKRAAKSLPTYGDIPNNQGNALAALGRTKEALIAYRRAIKLNAAHVDAWLNAGTMLHRLKRIEEAMEHFRRVTQLFAGEPRGHYNLAVCITDLLSQKTLVNRRELGAEAKAALDRAISIERNNPEFLFAYSNLCFQLGEHANAVAWVEKVIALQPERVEAWVNLGGYLEAQDRIEEAIAAFERSTALRPGYVIGIVNVGLAKLALGDLASGWDGYARRFDDPATGFVRRAWPWPSWQGEPLRNKRILLWSDQGIGDEIMYAGMIPEVVAQGALCTVECSARLVPLFERSFSARIVAKTRTTQAALLREEYDFQCSILDAGRFLRRKLGLFPNRMSYLRPDPKRTFDLRQRYKQQFKNRCLVGLSWRSINPKFGDEKSLELGGFLPLFRDTGATFLSLQYGDVGDEIEVFTRQVGVALFRDSTIDSTHDLDSLASQISALDIVVTISNSTAHLAGALGVPTCLFLPPGRRRLWYWLREGRFSPWYRSIRICREGLGDFLAGVQQVLPALAI